MKNILLGSIFVLVFLPQLSFGADQPAAAADQPPAAADQPSVDTTTPPPAVHAPFANLTEVQFSQRQDAESVAFFQKQAQERAAFISGNLDLMARSDHDGKKWAEYNAAQRHAMMTGDRTAMPPKPQSEMTTADQDTLAGFMAKQQTEKVAFMQKLDRQKQRFAATGSASEAAATN